MNGPQTHHFVHHVTLLHAIQVQWGFASTLPRLKMPCYLPPAKICMSICNATQEHHTKEAFKLNQQIGSLTTTAYEDLEDLT